MKFQATILLILCFLLGACKVLPKPVAVSPEQKLLGAVVQLLTVPPEGKGATGIATGFAINENQIVTVGHFCSEALGMMTAGKAELGYVLVVTSDNQGNPNPIGKGFIQAIGIDLDACIIEYFDFELEHLKLKKNIENVQTGSKFLTMGTPLAYFPVWQEGRISKLQLEPWRYPESMHKNMLLSIEVFEGSSGSPVYQNGEVIGMIIAYMNDPNRLGLAERSDKILEFVDRHPFTKEE